MQVFACQHRHVCCLCMIVGSQVQACAWESTCRVHCATCLQCTAPQYANQHWYSRRLAALHQGLCATIAVSLPHSDIDLYMNTWQGSKLTKQPIGADNVHHVCRSYCCEGSGRCAFDEANQAVQTRTPYFMRCMRYLSHTGSAHMHMLHTVHIPHCCSGAHHAAIPGFNHATQYILHNNRRLEMSPC